MRRFFKKETGILSSSELMSETDHKLFPLVHEVVTRMKYFQFLLTRFFGEVEEATLESYFKLSGLPIPATAVAEKALDKQPFIRIVSRIPSTRLWTSESPEALANRLDLSRKAPKYYKNKLTEEHGSNGSISRTTKTWITWIGTSFAHSAYQKMGYTNTPSEYNDPPPSAII